MQLFLTHGFDATTVDEIAASVGVSRRSLFRYFSSKEDLAAADVSNRGQAVLEALRAGSAAEDPWEALRVAVFGPSSADFDQQAHETLRVSRLLRENPSLQGFRLEKQKQWQELLTPEIARRLDGAGDVTARARGIVAAALSCADAAVDIWVERGGSGDVHAIFNEMIDTIRR